MGEEKGRIALICSCEDTMLLDGKALARGCGAGVEIRGAELLCLARD